MFKNSRMQYVIKSVPSDNTQALEDLLNEMSVAGWDLYSMHEVEVDEGYQYNCIFATDSAIEKEGEEVEDVVNINTFKSQMEKMLSSTFSPYDSCKEIQDKIKEQRKKIVKIKTQLEAQSEAPISKNRKHLNEEISKGLKELDELRQNLMKTISPEAMYSKLQEEKLSIHLSEEALELVNPDLGGVLIAETVKIRQKLAEELGYVMPKIIFQDDDKLSPFEFSIKIRGIEAVNSFVYPNYLMFFEDDLKLGKKQKDIIYATDEITGKKIVWIEEKKTKGFWQNGLTAAEFIARLLENIVIKNINELLDYTDMNHYMAITGEKNLFLIENIIPDFISVAELRYLLANLLREEISIKDIVFIFEKINDFVDENSREDLFDKLRLSLSRYISKKYSNADGVIQAFELSEETFKKIFSKMKSDEGIIRVDGTKLEKLANSIIKKVNQYGMDLNNIVILTPLEVRHLLFMVMSQFISNIRVVAKEEIANDYTVEILDEI
jgi:flagellar biosynthesis protein FlhA